LVLISRTSKLSEVLFKDGALVDVDFQCARAQEEEIIGIPEEVFQDV
jgi:hypothetical protein